MTTIADIVQAAARLDANQFLGWMRYGGGQAFYDELVNEMIAVNTVSFFTGPMPTQPLGWFNSPVEGPEALSGLKYRTVGLSADLFTAMGAAVTVMPGGEIVPNLQTGTLEAAEFNNPSSDLTLGFMLSLCRHLHEIEAYYRGGATRIEGAGDFLALYNRFTGRELNGLTIGLVGLGAVGREVAARLLAFKARVLAYDPHLATFPAGVERVDLDDLLRAADIVSLHAPVTADTTGLLSRAKLELTKPGALVVNTARAALTDEDALYELLRSGRLGGAALDVLAAEPLQPGNRFLELPTVIVTPHVGGATVDVVRHHSEQVVDAIERHLRGERPRWIANPAVLAPR